MAGNEAADISKYHVEEDGEARPDVRKDEQEFNPWVVQMLDGLHHEVVKEGPVDTNYEDLARQTHLCKDGCYLQQVWGWLSL